MPLTDIELRQRLKEPKYKKLIPDAVRHQERINLHTETRISMQGASSAINDYLRWVETLLSKDSFVAYKELFRLPLPSNALMEEVIKKQKRVFDGRDSERRFRFDSEAQRSEYEEIRTRQKIDQQFKEQSFHALRSSHNSIIVVDSKPDQEKAPYFYFIDIAKVYDLEEKEGKIDWIIFYNSPSELIVIDDEAYFLLDIPEGRGAEESIQRFRNPHTVTYCPANYFIQEPINRDKPHVKKSPYTNYLSSLDWYLFFTHNKQNLDLYAGQPIYSGYRPDCDFEIDGPDNEVISCSHGFLIDSNDRSLMDGSGLRRCPKCNKTSRLSPGTFITVATPSKDNDFTDLRNPVGITAIDRNSLNYNTEEKNRLKKELIEQITGYTGDPINNQAINQDQVYSFRESESAELRGLKVIFERAQTWVEETIIRLLWGNINFEVTISYGNEFYLSTPEMLSIQYGEAKAKGQPTQMLNEIEDSYYATKYRANPELLTRNKMISDIDPYRHIDTTTLTTLLDKKVISNKDYLLKVNFASLLAQFERENGRIEQFGIVQNYATRIKKIREELLLLINIPEQAPAPMPAPELN